MSSTNPVPPGFHTITPHLTVRGAADAIAFYGRAFGAEELARHEMPGGGAVMHASLRIGDSHLMLNDEFPQGAKAPDASTPVTMHLYVDDADALFGRAVEAGCEVVFPMDDTFWGDRYGLVQDPYGHRWSIATHVEDVSEEEMASRAAQAFGG